MRLGRTACVVCGVVLAGVGCGADSGAEKPTPAKPDAGQDGVKLSHGIEHENGGSVAPGDDVVLKFSGLSTVAEYRWTITDPDGGAVAVVAATPGATLLARVRFVATMPGTYDVVCLATRAWEGTARSQITISVIQPNAKALQYTARIIPRESGRAPVDKLVTVQGADQKGLFWIVDDGAERELLVTAADGTAIDTYLRLTATAGDPLPRELYLAKGVGKVTLGGMVHALFLPVSTTIPPVLQPYVETGKLPAVWTRQLPAGELVGGTVTASGTVGPIAGATVTIHYTYPKAEVLVPSTVGISGPTGEFTLRLDTTSHLSTLTIVPPPNKGLPVAVVDGLAIAAAAKTGWTFEYQAPTAVPFVAKVMRSDGQAAKLATVTVTLENATAVGKLTMISGGVSKTASGRYSATLTADQDGALFDPVTKKTAVLPAGTYTVEVWPATGELASEGYARRTNLIVAAPAQPLELALAPRARLNGVITDSNAKVLAGAVVTATAASGSFTGVTNNAGAFAIDVDDKVSYVVAARAIGESGQRLGVAIRADVMVSGTMNLQTLRLPLAAVVAGQVLNVNGTVVSRALIRIWCSQPGCPTSDIVDETQSLTDGRFMLRIPLPAQP